ncbi:ubiquinone biosynthesis methyltransferase UbiE [Sulfitobacter sp. F26204]|uniref:DUF6552 family protein n=1 Tax=Sulfitobacter sp. F26204 TaxID=2996014 RepID=UPI00225E435E|nr:DUF6552 family protein [Sulfitobacter sp. F26204]MCX7558576.1 ubiquinone biosynthesis methyltransferase UbiE [Sulfitobacter sp. F26204]
MRGLADTLPRLRPPFIERDTGITLLKWVASLVQIMGYTATAFGMTPLNIYLFLIGLVGWFTVGVLWKDKAIMLIHIVALFAMIAGMMNA